MAGKDDKDADKGTDDAKTDADDTGTDDGDTGDWQAPTRDEWDRVQAALKKARSDARAAKRGKPSSDKAGDTGDDKPDVDKAKADAAAEEAGKWKPRLVRAAARSAFVEAGLVLPKSNADAAMNRVVKLLDLDDLDINDDGEIDGLDEQIAEIKADWPDLFATNGRRPGRVDGADKGGQNGSKPKTASEIQAAILSGQRV